MRTAKKVKEDKGKNGVLLQLLGEPVVVKDPLAGLCLGAVIIQLACENGAANCLTREFMVGVAAGRVRSSARLPVGVPMHVGRRCSRVRLLTKVQSEGLRLFGRVYQITLDADEGYDPEDDSEFYLHFPSVVHSTRGYATQYDKPQAWGPVVISVEDHAEWLDKVKLYIPKARDPRQFEYSRRTVAVESIRIKSASSEEDESCQAQAWFRDWYCD